MALIKKDVMIIGVGNKIGNLKTYENFCRVTNKEFEKVSEKIDDENIQ